jgi:hypothetical protein
MERHNRHDHRVACGSGYGVKLLFAYKIKAMALWPPLV